MAIQTVRKVIIEMENASPFFIMLSLETKTLSKNKTKALKLTLFYDICAAKVAYLTYL